MKLSQFIEQMATVTGNGKLDSLKTFIESAKDLELPDEIANGINSSILTKESAKNNSEVYDHIAALVRNGFDTELDRFANDQGFDDNVKSEFKAIKKSADKAKAIALKLKEAEAAKVNAKGGDAKVLSEKIANLESALASANNDSLKQKETLEQKIKEAENEFTGKLKDYQVEKHFQGYQYANDKIPLDVHIMTAKGLFEKKAKELGLKTVFDKDTGEVKLLTTTDTVFYKDNRPVDYRSFTDALLADNHLLKVAGTTAPAEVPKFISTNNGGDAKLNTSKFESALQESASAFQKTN